MSRHPHRRRGNAARLVARTATRAMVEPFEPRVLLSVQAVSPLNGAHNVARASNLTVTFAEPMTASTVNASTLQLRGANNQAIAATVTYNASTRVATIDPTADLPAGAYVFARVVGGPGGVKTSSGAALANDFNWAFSTGTPTFGESSAFTGLTQPTAVEFSPDGRVFVAEKSGLIKVFDSLSDTTPDVFADLRTNVHNFWDRGLLGLALHPNFPSTPHVYVLYTYDAPIGGTAPTWGTVGGTSDGGGSSPTGSGAVVSGRLSRLTASGNVATGGEAVLIEDWANQFPSHSIGHLQFGPDGFLYASSGDGASFSFVDYGQVAGSHPITGDPTNEGGALRSQDIRTTGDPTTLDGTIIRINPTTGAAAAGNPLAGVDANRSRIIAHGLRNPFRFNFRPGTGEIWSGDVGWSGWEEINRINSVSDSKVENFGWPAYEGPNRQSGYDNANLPLLESLYSTPGAHDAPYYAYQHSAKVVPGSSEPTGGSSITGIAFYNGGSYPLAYDGALFFADYSRKQLYVMYAGPNGLPDTNNRQIFKSLTNGAVELQIGPGGDLFYVDMNGGRIQRFTYSAGANRAPSAAISADRTTGPLPLTVNFSGAGSTDPDANDALTFAWDLDGDGEFDDSTAIAPSFTYTTAGQRLVRLRVTDRGGLSDIASVTINPANSAPVPTISLPAAGFNWAVGQTISFSGSATDPEEGTLPASRLRWDLVLIHGNEIDPTNTHEHPIQTFSGVASGSFIAPDHEWPSWIELRLTATDATGLSITVTRQLDPRTVTLSFATSPSGLQIAYNGQTLTTPLSRTAIVGSSNSLSAFTQTFGGTTYNFASWSDGGAATHQITAPAASTTYTATYAPAAAVQPPVAPSGLSATVAATNRVELSWTDNSNNEATFAIERRYAGWIWESLASVGADVTSYADTSTIGNVIYEYRVRAVNSAGNSGYSNGVLVNTANVAAPGVPVAASNLSAVVVSSTRVRLTWNDNSTNETGFRVQRRNSGTSAWSTLVTTTANTTTYEDTTVTAGNAYEYRIVATNATGDATPSNVATASTAASGVPAAPSNLVGVLQPGGSVKLDWVDSANNESGFQIERRFAGWIWEIIGSVSADVRMYTDGTAIGNVIYEYRVAATSAAGLSPYSNGAIVNTGSQSTASTFAMQASVLTGARVGVEPLPASPVEPIFGSTPLIEEVL